MSRVPEGRGNAGTRARSLRELREDPEVDQTFQNLLKALILNLELRARYRVFEFEASEDGHTEIALRFDELRAAQDEHITTLMNGLRLRLGEAATPATGDPLS